MTTVSIQSIVCSTCLTALSSLLISIQGCTPTIESRGYIITIDTPSQVQLEQQTKENIRTVLGTPSSLSTFSDDTWYYISSKEEVFAFYRPQEIERKILAIHFNDEGTVREVKIYDLSNGQPIKPVLRITQTSGSGISILQQLLSNVGRFNRSKKQVE